MSQAEIVQHGAIEQLIERMRKFESAGLPKPPNYLLSDYLRFLVDNQLLPRETSDNVQAIYNAGRYGDAPIDAGILANTLSQLDAASAKLHEMDRSDIEALAEKLAGSQVSAETPGQVLAPVPANPALATAPGVPALPSRQSADNLSQFMPVANPPIRLSLRILAGGFLWTLIVLGAGYFGHDKVASLFKKEEPLKFQWENPKRKLVNKWEAQQGRQRFVNSNRVLIEQANSEQERQTFLDNLAQNHLRHGEDGEYYFIYDSLIRQDPNNPHYKIELAGFLLNPTTSWYHDPVRALKLAEESVALDATPRSLALLAEALSQTGDSQQAIEIQQQADIAFRNAKINQRGGGRGLLRKGESVGGGPLVNGRGSSPRRIATPRGSLRIDRD